MGPIPDLTSAKRVGSQWAATAHVGSILESLGAIRKRLRSDNWSIRARLVMLVLVLSVPLNLLIIGAIWQLANSGHQSMRSGLLYTARTIAGAVDLHVGKQVGLAQSLANSPALLGDDLATFAKEALRAFPPSGDAWLLVANPEGQQLFNTARQTGQALPQRNPDALAAQTRALQNRSIVVADRIVIGPLTKSWVATVEIPVFKDGAPFRVLAIAMKMQGFQRLLSGHEMPPGWLAGLIDAEGRFLARVPEPDRYVGQLASEGWRRVKDQEGVFEFRSIEGVPIVQGNARASLATAWTIGIAVPKSELQAAAWKTAQWAALLGALLSSLSLALAFVIARHIEAPIAELRKSAAPLLEGKLPSLQESSPEVRALADELQKAVAERRRGEEAAQRLAAIVQSSFDAIISKTLDGTVTSWNAGAETMFGYAAEEMIGHSIRRLIPSDRQHEEDDILLKLASNRPVEPFETIRVHKDGRTIPVSITTSPIADGHGRVIGASKIARDISEQKAREQQVQLLLGELNHRSKNIIAVVQAIAHRTAGKGPSDFLDRFTQRLRALAVNQDLLAKSGWQGIDLEHLLRDQLTPFAHEAQVRLSGPRLQVSAAAAQAIGMAAHELATNACKYGSLSTHQGLVEVTWGMDGGKFLMQWSETGGPPVQRPTSSGFGSIVTTTMLETAVQGQVEVDYAAAGLRWQLACPSSGIQDEHTDGWTRVTEPSM